MDAGLLKYKIVFQQPIVVPNSYGTAQDVVYTGNSVTVMARKIDVGGNKTIQNYEMFTSQLLQFEIRYRADIDESYRILCDGKYYRITAPFKSTEYKKNIIVTAELIQ